MRALKTIVATAVIVFTLTTVAMAGVQHFTRQNDRSGTQAQRGQTTYTVTLTAAQLRQLMGTQRAGTAKADTDAHRSQTHEVEHVRDTVRTTAHEQSVAQTGSATGGRDDDPGTCTPTDYDHDYDWTGSGDGQHQSGDGDHHSNDGGHHSGDAGEGCR